MAFIKLPGIEGWVFEPEETPGSRKKHDCPDCFYCQMCSDMRCRSCRKEKTKECGKNIENNKKD